MTIADLISELQNLNVDPDTPIHFTANNYDAEEPYIKLDTFIRRKKEKTEVAFNLYSEEIETIVENSFGDDY